MSRAICSAGWIAVDDWKCRRSLATASIRPLASAAMTTLGGSVPLTVSTSVATYKEAEPMNANIIEPCKRCAQICDQMRCDSSYCFACCGVQAEPLAWHQSSGVDAHEELGGDGARKAGGPEHVIRGLQQARHDVWPANWERSGMVST